MHSLRSPVAEEILACSLTASGDAQGCWVEWRVDNLLICSVVADKYDLGLALAASFGSDAAADIAAGVERAGAMDAILSGRLYSRGAREVGDEWTLVLL